MDERKNAPDGWAPPAGVWRRFMGMVYESLLLLGPVLVTGFLYSVVVDFSDRAGTESLGLKRLGLQLIIGLGLLSYFIWGWTKGRRTLPMQTLGLSLESTSGHAITRPQALLRALVAIPSALTGLGLIWALFDRDKQTPHDRVAGTRLVYRPVGRAI
jgi:uncharacterized RDD family membrane protein YckC